MLSKGWKAGAWVSVMVLVVLAAGCRPYDRSKRYGRVDPDRDDVIGGTGTESGDIRAMCDKFCRSMLGIPEIANAKGVPRVVLLPVKNRVNDVSIRFDADMLLVKMRTILNEQAAGKVRFLARDRMDDIRSERDAKDRGDVDRSAKKALSGADFFMTGEIRSLTKMGEAGKSNYILYAFQLIDAENSQIVWEGSYEQKRVDTRGTVYR